MRRLSLLLLLLMLLAVPTLALAAAASPASVPTPASAAPLAPGSASAAPAAATQDVLVRLQWEQGEVYVRMLDNAASRSFLAQLPLTLEFTDFANTEKIATLPQRLQTEGSLTAQQVPGDFAYYAPWGNLAVFYRGKGSDGQLYVLGHIASGKEALGRMKGAFRVHLSVQP